MRSLIICKPEADNQLIYSKIPIVGIGITHLIIRELNPSG